MSHTISSGAYNTNPQIRPNSQASTVYAKWTNSETPEKPPIAQQAMAMFRVAQATQRVHNTVSGK
jgi:hypothetical protein